jgi:hypothetical protein
MPPLTGLKIPSQTPFRTSVRKDLPNFPPQQILPRFHLATTLSPNATRGARNRIHMGCKKGFTGRTPVPSRETSAALDSTAWAELREEAVVRGAGRIRAALGSGMNNPQQTGLRPGPSGRPVPRPARPRPARSAGRAGCVLDPCASAVQGPDRPTGRTRRGRPPGPRRPGWRGRPARTRSGRATGAARGPSPPGSPRRDRLGGPTSFRPSFPALHARSRSRPGDQAPRK